MLRRERECLGEERKGRRVKRKGQERERGCGGEERGEGRRVKR